jgi:hypothetical protein
MLTLLRFAKYVPFLFALIKSTVELVEGTKAGLPGPEKKQAVLDAIAVAWPSLALAFGLTAPVSGILAVAGILIDLVVGVYNAVGVFTKSAPPAPVEAPPVAGDLPATVPYRGLSVEPLDAAGQSGP